MGERKGINSYCWECSRVKEELRAQHAEHAALTTKMETVTILYLVLLAATWHYGYFKSHVQPEGV